MEHTRKSLLHCDQWEEHKFELLMAGDPGNGSFAGCQHRVAMGQWDDPIYIAINLTRTGKDFKHEDGFSHRVKVEFVGDGEPSTFTHGWKFIR